MSTTIAVPPPNSSSVMRRAPRLTERARALLTTMNLHFAGVAAFVVLTLWLLIHGFIVWNKLQSNNDEALANQTASLHAAQIAALPVKGLDTKVAKSTADADDFYGDRLPYAYSQVAAELGVLTKKSGVRLSRVQYTQAPVLQRNPYALTEVRMDASVSGDYRPTVQFINALERDPMFFLVSGLNISGQQTGQVNLRLRIITYLREPDADEMTHDLSVPGTDAAAPAPATAGGAQ